MFIKKIKAVINVELSAIEYALLREFVEKYKPNVNSIPGSTVVDCEFAIPAENDDFNDLIANVKEFQKALKEAFKSKTKIQEKYFKKLE